MWGEWLDVGTSMFPACSLPGLLLNSLGGQFVPCSSLFLPSTVTPNTHIPPPFPPLPLPLSADASSLREAFNDATYFRDEAVRAFKLGVLSLEERAQVGAMSGGRARRVQGYSTKWHHLRDWRTQGVCFVTAVCSVSAALRWVPPACLSAALRPGLLGAGLGLLAGHRAVRIDRLAPYPGPWRGE